MLEIERVNVVLEHTSEDFWISSHALSGGEQRLVLRFLWWNVSSPAL